MTKSRIFLYTLLAFIFGVAMRSFIAIPYEILLFGFLAGAVAAVIGILRRRQAVWVYGLLVLAVLVGIVRFDTIERVRPNLTSFYNKPLTLQGVVWEEPRRTSASQQLKVKIAEVDESEITPPFYALVTTRRYPEYALGEELRLQGILEKPENLGDFDYASYLAKDEIFSAVSFPQVERIGMSDEKRITRFLVGVKRALEDNIDAALPDPHSALLKGLLFGERESLPPEFVEDLKKTGTTHIIALSGYNITLVGRFFMDALLFLTVPFYTAFWIAISAIISFVLATGASPSVVRAGVMGILVLIAQREGRIYRMTNALAFAGAVMIFHNPRILRLDAAFQLSFLATLGIVYLAPQIESAFEKMHFRLTRRPKFNSARKTTPPLFPFKQILTETLAAQLAVLPLLLYLFGRVSLISPLANVLVLLAVPYSMALGFAAAMLGFVSGLMGSIAGWLVWALLEYKIRVIELLASL